MCEFKMQNTYNHITVTVTTMRTKDRGERKNTVSPTGQEELIFAA